MLGVSILRITRPYFICAHAILYCSITALILVANFVKKDFTWGVINVPVRTLLAAKTDFFFPVVGTFEKNKPCTVRIIARIYIFIFC